MIVVTVVCRFCTAFKNLVNQGRAAPADSQHHVSPCAHYASLGHTSLLNSRCSIFKVVNNQIGSVNHLIEALIHTCYQLGIGIETELVYLTGKIIVTVELACSIDIVAGKIEQCNIRANDVFTLRAGYILCEYIISGSQGAFGIIIGLIEILICYDTFLRYVKFVLAGRYK
ncbi:MAG: hypothetical protein BWY95_02688 [Bacteroidetes bacterium ADurb.BinA104]|nr:MAG: hypothetical protein BWY95_02688 [Bacteroidetes bacterium ADurb.BinA104]